MHNIRFSQLPIWYRLTWVLCASVFVIVTYAVLFFAYMEFSDPAVACWEVGKIKTDVSPDKWVQGENYEIYNSVLQNAFRYPPDKQYKFHYYTDQEQGWSNTFRLDAYRNQCDEVNVVIGELYPIDFSIAHEVSGYSPDFFVDENYIIFETLSGGK